MEITVRKTSDRPKTMFVRRDGVRYELLAVDRKFVPPHDVVHVIVEDALKIRGGFIGTISQGGLFPSLRHIGGRRPPQAERNSKQIIRVNKDDIRASEVAAGAFQDALLKFDDLPLRSLQERLGDLPQTNVSLESASTIWAELKRVGFVWQNLTNGESITLHWTYKVPEA